MKIELNKNINNINEESKISLKEFKKKQILSNIKYHKLFLFLIILVNIGLLIFILLYKSKIGEIKKLSKDHTSTINSQDKLLSLKYSSFNNKMVNIAAINGYNTFRFSIIFETNQEFNSFKNIIYDYQKRLENHPIIDSKSKQHFFIYQSMVDYHDYKTFMERIAYFKDIAILIKTGQGNRFGIYIKDAILPNKNYEFEPITNNIFLYSFETKKIYNFIGDKQKSLSFKKEKLLILGDNELIIFNEFYDNGGYINYPFKSFDLNNVNKNIFTENNGQFYIDSVEVFSFMQN